MDQVARPEHEMLRGRKIGEIAEGLGKEPFDAMLDLAISEDLLTSFMPTPIGDDDASWKLRAEVWRDPRAVVGASDAGAHLDMIDTFAVPTQVLGNGVRRHGVIGLEEAVRQLSDVPARLYGVRERGRLEPGWHADVVVFDPAAQWTVRPEEFYSKSRNTPFAGRRLKGRAETTIVRGQVVFARGADT